MGVELKTNQSVLSRNNTNNLVLYTSAGSPCARRVKISLVEKGLDFDTVEVDLSGMEQRSPDYLSLNPNGYVPCLAHGPHVVYESSVINQYLEDQFSTSPTLIPTDALQKAQVTMWIEFEAYMAKVFRPLMYQRLQGPILHISRTLEEDQAIIARSTDSELDKEWHKKVWNVAVLNTKEEAEHEKQLLDWLDKIENALADSDYLVANQFTQADISLFPRIEMYSYLGIQLDPMRYKNVLDWMQRLALRPSFEASMTDEAKSLRKIASSSLLPKIRQALNKAKPSLKDTLFLWAVGKVIRNKQKVKQQLSHQYQSRSLPKPKPHKHPINVTTVPMPQALSSEDKQQITLFKNALSVHSIRIENLLKRLNLSYTSVEENLDSKSKQLLSANPLGQVPTLIHNDQVIFDSAAIAEYLIQQFDKDNNWLPSKSDELSINRMWLALEKGAHKEFKPFMDEFLFNKSQPQAHTVNHRHSLIRIELLLTQIEDALTQHRFICSDKIRFADLAWHSRILALQYIPDFSLTSFPAITRWLTSVSNYIEKD